MNSILLIAFGGALGSVLRYAVGAFCANHFPTFPWGTMTVNVTGCFAIGLLSAVLVNGDYPEEYRLLLAVGFLGGFTTFSSYGLDAMALILSEKAAQGILYLAATNALGLLAVYAGMKLGGWK